MELEVMGREKDSTTRAMGGFRSISIDRGASGMSGNVFKEVRS